ncbi:la-related protein 1B-like protein [Cinnamomum micranthum f. kanehirae]|uniref:La-related protein 1B-like protein n=1 Tax=Cinnamomum micranthum f. kanehirae TaxID=337451 RepID=A0A443PHJ1_9MAGN|nr:la-related protein 1B-like protein [Cinnamomum micranthum f. kanehirae]
MDSPNSALSDHSSSIRPAWKKFPTGIPIPVMGDESWPSLTGPSNSNDQETSLSPSLSSAPMSCPSSVSDSDSEKVEKFAVELPTVSSPVISDSASASMASTSSVIVSENGDVGCPIQSPNPSPQPQPQTNQNRNPNPQFRRNLRNKNRRYYHQGGFNHSNGNMGFVPRPFNYYLNRPPGMMNGPGSFLPPPPPPYFPPSNLQSIPDYGVYYNPYFQDVYAPPHHATYHAPDFMNGISMYLEPHPSPPVAIYMQQYHVELHNALRKQIEYYFSHDNLLKDYYLRSKMDEEGWVSIQIIADFNRVKAITQDMYLILEALRPSTIIEVQRDKIRRRGDWMVWILTSGSSSTTRPTMDTLATRIQSMQLGKESRTVSTTSK